MDDLNKKEQRLEGVIMPDESADPLAFVEGTKEYRRNAMIMILGGSVMLFGPFVLLLFIDRFFFVLPIVGLAVIGMGINKLLENSETDEASDESSNTSH